MICTIDQCIVAFNNETISTINKGGEKRNQAFPFDIDRHRVHKVGQAITGSPGVDFIKQFMPNA
jgi:hypothetical protein